MPRDRSRELQICTEPFPQLLFRVFLLRAGYSGLKTHSPGVVALRGLRPLWRLRRPRHIRSSCDALEPPAPSHARLLAGSGAAAFGRSGHWQRGLRPRGSLRHPLALALACHCLEPGSPNSRGRHVRFKNYVVRGDASFCAERKIPTTIARIADKGMQGFREQMPRRPGERLQDKHNKLDASRRAEKRRGLRVKAELR